MLALRLQACQVRTQYLCLNTTPWKVKIQIRAFAAARTLGDHSHAPFPVFREVPPLRSLRRTMHLPERQVGFVPTMGALHDGHISLIRHALRENTDVFVSIFVNPTQFGVNEDLAAYPKTWAEDVRKLEEVQEEYTSSKEGTASRICGIFAPTIQTMYPTLPPSSEIDAEGSFVTITPLGKLLEGASRPVFFRGVATVCMKLFNIVQPDRVYFGQKDVQQSVLIKRLVKDFHIPTEVRVIPTSREPNGLAMSSRNVHLGARRWEDVSVLYRALSAAAVVYDSDISSVEKIRKAAFGVFERDVRREDGSYGRSCSLLVDYISLSCPDDMSIMKDHDTIDPAKGAILSAAMKVMPVDDPKDDQERNQISVRLIDNVILEPRHGN